MAMVYECPFIIRIHDVDAAGIVFFARYWVLMHDVYEAFLHDIGHSISDAIEAGEYIIPIVESHARYRRPMRHGEPITGRLVVRELKRTSYAVEVTFAGADGAPRAVMTTHHVCVDAATLRPRALPEGLVRALADYLDPAQAAQA